MATAMDPFEGAKAEREDQRRQLLDAVSTGGAAAKKAYDDAQAAVAASRQDALNRAQQRAQITGTNFGGQDLNPVADAAGLMGGYLSGQSAAGQQHLQSIGASGESYLAKVGAIAPFIQSQNIDKAAQRENEYKTAIAQAQAKIDADKAAQEQEFARQKELLALKDMYETRQSNASAAAKAKAATATKATLPQLIGLANQEPGYMRDNQNILGQAKGGENIAAANLLQRAGQYGRQLGVDPLKLAELGAPGQMNTLAGQLTKQATAPAPPPVLNADFLRNFKYDGKPISSTRTQEVLRAPEVQETDRFIREMLNTKIRNGIIDDTGAGDFNGMRPVDAFNEYLNSLPGIRTMKEALKAYYLPWIESNLRG